MARFVYAVTYEDQRNLSGDLFTSGRKAIEHLKQFGSLDEDEPLKIIYSGLPVYAAGGRAEACKIMLA